MTEMFRIALTADFYTDGEPAFPDFDLSVLDTAPGIKYAPFAEHAEEIHPEQIADANGVIVLTPHVTQQSLLNSDNLLAISRFGVGYDGVDVAACTDADVALLITSGAVDRPVAEATIGWMIALSHHMQIKDRLVREGRWDDRKHYMGSELRDRTLGLIGFGGIARELVKLLSTFGMQETLVFDPYIDATTATELGVKQVELDELLTRSDFVSLHCPLNDSTKDLIGEREISLMKATAFLINTARGGIINEDALFEALTKNTIAGAALDCFSEEPFTSLERFEGLENILLAPHSIAWTHELFRDIGNTACQSLIDLALGRRPSGIVNPEVFDRPCFQEKWKRLTLSNTP